MNYIWIIALSAVVVGLGLRLFFMKKAIREASKQLAEINTALQENREVRLTAPNRELEELLLHINHSLQAIRAEKVAFGKRELEFKQQMEGISHDLRTPLTSMLGYLRIMDMSKLGEEERQDLQTVLLKAERLQELITEVYDFSRLSAGEYGLQMKALDVTGCLRNALADGYADLEKRGLNVQVEIEDGPLIIRADEGALKRVFQNLLQNALRYAVSSLEVEAYAEGESVVVSFRNDVSDLGERDIERLFERFYTRDSARSSGATGLGLAIAKGFIEEMQGHMEATLIGKMLCINMQFQRLS